MGSLMPGWSNDLPGPPKDMQEYPDEEPAGYFASYQKQKTLKRSSLAETAAGDRPGSLVPQSSLSRRSFGPTSPSLGRQASIGRSQAVLRGDPAAIHAAVIDVPSLTRSSSLPSPAGAHHISDDGSIPDAMSLGGHIGSYDPKADKGPHSKYKWWSKLDSGFLNDAPLDDSGTEDVDSKGFVPQYGATGQQLNYRMPSDSSSDGAAPVHAH